MFKKRRKEKKRKKKKKNFIIILRFVLNIPIQNLQHLYHEK